LLGLLFDPEHGNSTFLHKNGELLTRLHAVTSQEIVLSIVTAAGT
jgi:hypothetical protein